MTNTKKNKKEIMEIMKNFKNLLTITRECSEQPEDEIIVWTKWQTDTGREIENTVTLTPETLFTNKKLIYCLAYINYYNEAEVDPEDIDWNTPIFGNLIPQDNSINDLQNILSDIEPEETLMEMSITYYDKSGRKFDITFAKIINSWENKSHQEICDEINSIN